ncbi:MAG: RNA-binding cell elongation regulator Jag/EloR [Lachnospiraceae bacterium]
MDSIKFEGKTVAEALTKASIQLGIASDELQYTVESEGKTGFFGIGAKPAVILVKKKEEEALTVEVKKEEISFTKPTVKPVEKSTIAAVEADKVEEKTKEFLEKLFHAMQVEVNINLQYNENTKNMDIDLSGDDMGILIGKRGQTLDSLQYLTSLYVNKESDSYIRVKMDTENYRERRKETLEHLAKNIAYKVKRTRKSVSLEPMNPYERRIIHSALQNDRYVYTKSEGEEPYRKVVIMLKRS